MAANEADGETVEAFAAKLRTEHPDDAARLVAMARGSALDEIVRLTAH